ncbi:MAG: amidohydrolase family protein [Chloroflexota bacterium]
MVAEVIPAADGAVLSPDWILAPEGVRYGWSLAVSPPAITAVGPREAVLAGAPGLAERRLPGRGLVPGLVDCHTHLSESFAKALTFYEPAQLWRRLWFPLETALTPEDAHAAALLACWESLRGGFTTVVESACKSPEASDGVLAGVLESGIRCAFSHHVVDRRLTDVAGDAAPATATELACAAVDEHVARCRDLPARVSPSLNMGLESCSPELLLHGVELARRTGATIQFHANQHTREVEQILDRYGVRPIERLADVGALGPWAIVGHAVLTTAHEISLLAQTGAGVAYNPFASVWKGNAVCRAAAMHEAGVRLGIGTDATTYDGFRTLLMAETLQHVLNDMPYDDFRGIPAAEWLRIGTVGGADVAGLSGVAGRLAPQHAADLLILDFDRPELTPSWDPESEIVRLADRGVIEEVMVEGRTVLRWGQPVHFDGPALLAETRRLAAATLDRARPIKFSEVARPPALRRPGTQAPEGWNS